MDLDKKVGIATIRVWGLVVNLVMNFLALYGAGSLLRNESGPSLMILGLLGTVLCIWVLSKPVKDQPK